MPRQILAFINMRLCARQALKPSLLGLCEQPKMNSSERFAPQTIQRQAAQKQFVLGETEGLKGFWGKKNAYREIVSTPRKPKQMFGR